MPGTNSLSPAPARFANWSNRALADRAALERVTKGSWGAAMDFVDELARRSSWNRSIAHNMIRAEIDALRAERIEETGEDYGCFTW